MGPEGINFGADGRWGAIQRAIRRHLVGDTRTDMHLNRQNGKLIRNAPRSYLKGNEDMQRNKNRHIFRQRRREKETHIGR